MDCGAPRFTGPGAKKLYEYIMKASEEAKANKESREEKRKKRLEEFEEQMKKKQRHDYSIAKYINMHSEAQMEVVADELKQQLDKGNKYPSAKVFEIPYTIEDARACLFWDDPDFPEDIRFLPWKQFTDAGWYVEYSIFDGNDRKDLNGYVHLFPPDRNKGFRFSTYIRHNYEGEPC